MQSVISSRLPISTSTGFRVARGVAAVVAASALLALCAHISLPLLYTPVPITMQTFAVILLGMMLGPRAGFAAMSLYLAEGLSGMPVFSPHGLGGVAQIAGPTGGFLLSYPLAAGIAGAVAQTLKSRTSLFTAGMTAGLLASVVVFAIGATWMSVLLHLSATTSWHLAVAPFLPGELLKLVAAATLFATLNRFRQA